MKWITENLTTILAVLAFLPTLATALTKAPQQGDTAAWLRWGLGLLSLVKHQAASLPGLPAAPAPTVANATAGAPAEPERLKEAA